jgi:hypothetical protein
MHKMFAAMRKSPQVAPSVLHVAAAIPSKRTRHHENLPSAGSIPRPTVPKCRLASGHRLHRSARTCDRDTVQATVSAEFRKRDTSSIPGTVIAEFPSQSYARPRNRPTAPHKSGRYSACGTTNVMPHEGGTEVAVGG